MVIFYARWQKNEKGELQQTQVLVTDESENGGDVVVTTVRKGERLCKAVASVRDAMDTVAEICRRLGEGQ